MAKVITLDDRCVKLSTRLRRWERRVNRYGRVRIRIVVK